MKLQSDVSDARFTACQRALDAWHLPGTGNMDHNKIYFEDCLETMSRMPDNFLDSIVTDPPYGLSFMGKSWDYQVPDVKIWEEALRVLKPGGHLLAFAGTRTQHRMAVNIEDGGFEIRDMMMWAYGSGFPKSHNIGKAVDELQGNEREVVEGKWNHVKGDNNKQEDCLIRPGGKHKDSKGTSEWEGWGTALKPALEPITVARKPISEDTIAENCLKWGTGGINIDGCRIEMNNYDKTDYIEKRVGYKKGFNHKQKSPKGKSNNTYGNRDTSGSVFNTKGRFPANLILSTCEEVRECFPYTEGGGHQRGSVLRQKEKDTGFLSGLNGKIEQRSKLLNNDGTGSAARYFKSIVYEPKASKSERGKGNTHPTVKPVRLMRYLIKLVTRKDGITYDPFGGSGTSAIAAHREGVDWIMSERDEESFDIAKRRVKRKTAQKQLF